MFNKFVKALGIVLFFGGNFGYNALLAQNIIPNNDGVNTNVNFDSLNNTFNIDGGTTSSNNLFHSFQQFGLDNGQIANFLSQPNIVNILSRINGGNPSVINGIINSNANLFLMNPAGIIFGQNASLNINGDFTATTATGIGFENGFFNNVGTVDYTNLISNPVSYQFDQTGGIIYNAANLELLDGKNLSLLGNSVINEGTLSTINGNILLYSVPETGLLTVSFPNSLIKWEISAPTNNDGSLTVQNFLNAIKGKDDLGVTVVEDNPPTLRGKGEVNITPENGKATITGNIYAPNSDVQLLGNNIELLTENSNNYSSEIYGKNINLTADNNVSITNIYLYSENGDTNLIAGNDINIQNTENSYYDSTAIYNYGGDINLTAGNNINIQNNSSFNEISLNSNGGNINLTADNSINIDNYSYLNSGIYAFDNSDINSSEITGGNINLTAKNSININNSWLDSDNHIYFTPDPNLQSTGGNITLKADNSITINDPSESFDETTIEDYTITSGGGNVNIEAGQNIKVGFIASANDQNGGNITLTSTSGNIDATVDEVITTENGLTEIVNYGALVSSADDGNGGNVTITAPGDVNTGVIVTAAGDTGKGGDVTITSSNGKVDTTARAENVNPQFIKDVLAAEGINLTDAQASELSAKVKVGLGAIVTGSNTGEGGNISIQSNGDVRTGFLVSATLGNEKSGDINITSTNGGIDTVSTIDAITPEYLDSLNIQNLLTGWGVSPTLAEAASKVSISLGLIASGSYGDGDGGNVNLNAAGDIKTGAIVSASLYDGKAGNVTLTSQNGSIDATYDYLIDGITSDLLTELDVDTDLASQLDNVGVRLGIFAFSQNNDGGDVTLKANGDIKTSNIVTGSFYGSGGNIDLTSTQGSIDTTKGIFFENASYELFKTAGLDDSLAIFGDYLSKEKVGGLVSLSLTGNAGEIKLNAEGDINTNYLISSSFSGNAGAISLNSNNGGINVKRIIVNMSNDLTSPSLFTTTNNEELDEIIKMFSEGTINSSSTLGNGGKVTVSAANDIEIDSINAEGGIFGGDVNLKSDKFIRITDIFLNSLNQEASISTIAAALGGSITIEHGGGGKTPFIIGDAEVNGTAGIITSGTTEFNDGSFLFTTKIGNIAIISVNEENPTTEFDPEKIKVEPVNNQVTFNANIRDIKQLDEAEDILAEIQAKTGVKPALIYVSFSPKNISSKDVFGRKENNFTNDFEEYLNRDQKTANPVIAIEEQDSDILELIIVTQGETLRYTVEDATRDKVSQLNNILRREITTPVGNDERLLVASQKLYEWLIKPLETDLNRLEINNLVFVMDSGLRSVPLAALHDGNGYIIEKYSVGLMPSLSLVDTTYTPLKNLQILAMGAETFTNQTPLPAVPTELRIITQEIWKGQSFLNQDFTVDNLLLNRKSNPVGILHLATHGEFNSGKPENSYIQFGDRRLGLNELSKLRLNKPAVELMVLSACKTALGDNDAELGFAGLAYQAGVKTALGSLWYVSDEGTLGLMSSFYQDLLTAPIKAEALREAQLAMLKGEVRIENGRLISGDRSFELPKSLENIKNKDLKHPFYWSAFTMIGNPW